MSKLPKYVYKGRSAYEYKPYRGVGVPRPTIKLAPLSASMSQIWAAWEARQAPVDDSYTLGWLLREYAASRQFTHKGTTPKATASVREQRRQVDTVSRYPMREGHTFGSLKLTKITPGVIRRFLDKRQSDGAGKMGNRERALISVAWNWARERDIVTLPNPCAKVSRNPEPARSRYVTNEEYDVAYALAGDGPWYLRPAMEFAFLCRMRASEVLSLTWGDISEEALLTTRLKGSRTTLTAWSDRLDAARDACEEFGGRGLGSAPLLRNRQKQQPRYDALKSAWQRLMVRVEACGYERFTFHDLKAKGATDFEGSSAEKQDAGGWKEPGMVDRYDRKPRLVKPTR